MSVEICLCAAYRHQHRGSLPLKRAIQSGFTIGVVIIVYRLGGMNSVHLFTSCS